MSALISKYIVRKGEEIITEYNLHEYHEAVTNGCILPEYKVEIQTEVIPKVKYYSIWIRNDVINISNRYYSCHEDTSVKNMKPKFSVSINGEVTMTMYIQTMLSEKELMEVVKSQMHKFKLLAIEKREQRISEIESAKTKLQRRRDILTTEQEALRSRNLEVEKV